MRLDGNGDLANLGHALLGRVIRLFDEDALLLGRLRVVLFEDALHCPLQSRPGERVCEHAASVLLAKRLRA